MRTGSMRVAEISLPAIRHNVRSIRQRTGGAIIAVVKANGYGHGADIVARAAVEGGADLIAVADLEEAVRLRDEGLEAPLLCWLHGSRVDFSEGLERAIEIGVSTPQQLEAVAEAAARLGRAATVQLKIDTGLSRNGLSPALWDATFSRAEQLQREGLLRVRGIFSHLANAGAENDRAQALVFDDALARLRVAGVEPEMIHLAASAAMLSSPHLHYNTVRVGVAVYGLSPFPDKTSAQLGLIPAMTLKSEIVALRSVPAGTGVSYGFNHVCQSDTTLGLVPVGYADGMPRALNGAGATVTVAGAHCPIVGRIGMDQFIVDLGALGSRIGVGEPVVLFGDPERGVTPVELWAELLRTINYEVVAGIGHRVVRVPVDGEATGAQGAAAAEDAAETIADAGSPGQGAPVEWRVEIDDPDQMHSLGLRLGGRLEAGDLVILTGPLGAGKTTLTRGIGEGLGVRGPVTSPTFVLARTHPSQVGGPPLVHVDAYRLADATELDDLDLDYEASVVVAEWGAGLVEERGSWLEIVIERPTGAGAAEADAGANADGAVGDEPDWSEAPVEPRLVSVRGFGPRWAEGVLG